MFHVSQIQALIYSQLLINVITASLYDQFQREIAGKGQKYSWTIPLKCETPTHCSGSTSSALLFYFIFAMECNQTKVVSVTPVDISQRDLLQATGRNELTTPDLGINFRYVPNFLCTCIVRTCFTILTTRCIKWKYTVCTINQRVLWSKTIYQGRACVLYCPVSGLLSTIETPTYSQRSKAQKRCIRKIFRTKNDNHQGQILSIVLPPTRVLWKTGSNTKTMCVLYVCRNLRGHHMVPL